eukprot:CAMPEP_0184658172 /NCGR_PEP_ID=MMETSP0308-20130426/23904_1 /TAXON_ID=38269 /ORGANISM="Gloeochaete witrockiana, Strain SAG 46.84" /LENGTH=248 /DNA_ID=CAMNT_0027096883 /DNA_START=211 /DNA_END=957 /DNA_ORIENTATION=+
MSIDTSLTKVFVGGLAWQTKNETLQAYFAQFGELIEAVVITDRATGRSRGYGFVTYVDPEAAKRATVDTNPLIDGRRTNCNIAAQGAKPKSHKGKHFHGYPPSPNPYVPGYREGGYHSAPSSPNAYSHPPPYHGPGFYPYPQQQYPGTPQYYSPPPHHVIYPRSPQPHHMPAHPYFGHPTPVQPPYPSSPNHYSQVQGFAHSQQQAMPDRDSTSAPPSQSPQNGHNPTLPKPVDEKDDQPSSQAQPQQ